MMARDFPKQVGGPVLSLVRIIVGFLFATHGVSSLFGVLGGGRAGGGVAAFLAWPSWWAAVIELVGGVLVMLGLGTRIAALICSGTMAYAYFMVHQRNGALPLQNGGEPAALFCWVFLLIAALGPGPLALEPYLRGLFPARGGGPKGVAATDG